MMEKRMKLLEEVSDTTDLLTMEELILLAIMGTSKSEVDFILNNTNWEKMSAEFNAKWQYKYIDENAERKISKGHRTYHEALEHSLNSKYFGSLLSKPYKEDDVWADKISCPHCEKEFLIERQK